MTHIWIKEKLGTTFCKRNAGEVLIMKGLIINKRWCKLKVKCNKSRTTLTSGRCVAL